MALSKQKGESSPSPGKGKTRRTPFGEPPRDLVPKGKIKNNKENFSKKSIRGNGACSRGSRILKTNLGGKGDSYSGDLSLKKTTGQVQRKSQDQKQGDQIGDNRPTTNWG